MSRDQASSATNPTIDRVYGARTSHLVFSVPLALVRDDYRGVR
jgi:hypothetical protein